MCHLGPSTSHPASAPSSFPLTSLITDAGTNGADVTLANSAAGGSRAQAVLEAELFLRSLAAGDNTESAFWGCIMETQGEADGQDLGSGTPAQAAAAAQAAQAAAALASARAVSGVNVKPTAAAAALRRASLAAVAAAVPSEAQRALLQRLAARRRLPIDPRVFHAIMGPDGSGGTMVQTGPAAQQGHGRQGAIQQPRPWQARAGSAVEPLVSESLASASTDLDVPPGAWDVPEPDSAPAADSAGGADAPMRAEPQQAAGSWQLSPTPGLLFFMVMAVQQLEEAAEAAVEAAAAAEAAALGLPPPATRRQMRMMWSLLRRAARGVQCDPGDWLRRTFLGTVPLQRLRKLIRELVGEEYASGEYDTMDYGRLSVVLQSKQAARAKAMVDMRSPEGFTMRRGALVGATGAPILNELLGSVSREGAAKVIDRLRKEVDRLPKEEY